MPVFVTLTCSQCGKEFQRVRFKANRTVTLGLKSTFCGRECFAAARSRPGLPKAARKAERAKWVEGQCRYCLQPSRPGRKSCQACAVYHRNWQVEYIKKKKASGKCFSCSLPAAPGRKYCDYHMQEKNITTMRNNRKVKIEAMEAYGGCRCQCCGEDRIEFLSLDHINNDGAAHRRQLFGKNGGKGGADLYRKLKKLGYPPGLRTMCFNCNASRGFSGECPHARERRLAQCPPFTFIA